MNLERLYKTSAKGATQIIDMEIIGDTYTSTWGQLDGKMQSKSTTAKPKNVGKANATTAEEQAIIEAKAVWAKKQKANYSTSAEAPVKVLLPMKVSNYHDHKGKISFPCFASLKLNGINCEYRLVDGELKLLSRGGEEYPIPAHQHDEIVNLLTHLTTDAINGEMYCHGEHLQDIMAATKKHNELTPRLTFYAFDFPNIAGDYNTRCTDAYGKVENGLFTADWVRFVEVTTAEDHDELDEIHEEAVEDGFEGIIVRNPKGLYKYNTRSLDVFKYKVAQDAEFEVVDYSLDKNGHVVFKCKTTSIETHTTEDSPDFFTHQTFKVKLKGTNEERLAMAAEADNYIGKFLKVEFEELSKAGVPLKPVGIMFRKIDDNGEAIE